MQFLLPHLYIVSWKCWENVLFKLGVKGLKLSPEGLQGLLRNPPEMVPAFMAHVEAGTICSMLLLTKPQKSWLERKVQRGSLKLSQSWVPSSTLLTGRNLAANPWMTLLTEMAHAAHALDPRSPNGSQDNVLTIRHLHVTLSLPRVINTKFPLQPYQKHCITEWRTWIFIAYSYERWLYY